MAWRRLIRFEAKEDGKVYCGEPEQDGDVGLLHHGGARLTARVLEGSPFSASAKLSSRRLEVKRLLAPLAPSDITAIRGLGAQYHAPSASKPAAPEVPVVFYKPLRTVAGPGDAIVLPRAAKGEKNDYETELTIVIGRECKDVSPESAPDYVLGFCVANDVSSRGLTAKGQQWGVGKSFDTWCPIGPALVHPSQLRPDKLELKTTVNGKVQQQANTSQMIINVAGLVSRLSQGTTLEAGSLILTGTPAALNRSGDNIDPWLKHGDDVHCWVEGCGTLINPVIEEERVGRAKL